GADPGRLLGEHPDKGGPIVVKNGRYGPYVSHDGINATLPSDLTPETVSLEQAVGLVDARASRGDRKKTPARQAKTTARKRPAKPSKLAGATVPPAGTAAKAKSERKSKAGGKKAAG